MKILQTRLLKKWALTTPFLAWAFTAFAQPPASLPQADSLYDKHQYTQSFAVYEQLLQQKKYSPSMLLKMAYIQEGLGHLSLSLYYLNLYYLATDDRQALKKMEETAARHRLVGYENSESLQFFAWLREYNYEIIGFHVALIIFLLAVMIYRRQRHHARPVLAGFFLLFFSALLYTYIYYSRGPSLGVVIESPAYLMSGPSAGSSTVAILTEGHQLEILARRDVWVNVRWMDKEVYVKENVILPVEL